MKQDFVGDSPDRITEDAVANSTTNLVPQDSVLMVVRSGILNHTFPVAVSDREVTINQDMRALIPSEGIDARYLALALRRLQRDILHNCSKDGTTVASVEPARLENVLVPIAPAAEQRRIVARIDELFTEIADGETALARASEDLDSWRRALLKAAVSGELTRQWRKHHRPNETAVDVIRALRGTRIGLAQAEGERGSSHISDQLPTLPETWQWSSLSELSESVRNGTSKVPRAGKNRNEILRISSVRPMLVDVTRVRYLDDEQAIAATPFVVEPGDLLFTRYNGSSDLVGVGAIYRDTSRFYPDKLIRVRIKSEVRDYAEFIEIAVNTWVSRRHIASNIKTTAGQQGISGGSLKATPIPLPPRAEAVEIISRIRAEDDEIKAELNATRRVSMQLRQAALKAAFEGRLVDQDSSDGTAEQLLARLAEISPATSGTRRRRRSKAEPSLPLLDLLTGTE